MKRNRKFVIPGWLLVFCLGLCTACASPARTAVPYTDASLSPPSTGKPTQELIISPTGSAPIVQSTTTPQIAHRLTESNEPALSPTFPLPTALSSPELNNTLTPDARLHGGAVTVPTSDLIFLAGTQLMRWDHITDYLGLLAERVVDFSVSTDSQKILLLRTQQITASGIERFNLEILSLDTMQITTILSHIPRPREIALSPDGKWAALISGDQLHVSVVQDPALSGLSGEAAERRITTCLAQTETSCTELSWSPNSMQLLWSDADGVWIATLPAAVPHQILKSEASFTDPRGNPLTVGIQLSDWRWSPAGRFVLTTVHPTDSEVRWTAVLDTLTGRLVELPDTYSAGTFFSAPGSATPNVPASIAWLQDGKLVEAYGGSTALRSLPVVKIWQILPTRNELIYPFKTFVLQSRDFPLLPSLSETSVTYRLDWINQTREFELVFGMAVPGLQTPPVLFTLDLQRGDLTKLQEIPFSITSLLWCPDGSGAIILGSEGQILYASLANRQLRDLKSLFGLNATHFQWLRPTPRQ